jgi:hypothetical protein
MTTGRRALGRLEHVVQPVPEPKTAGTGSISIFARARADRRRGRPPDRDGRRGTEGRVGPDRVMADPEGNEFCVE